MSISPEMYAGRNQLDVATRKEQVRAAVELAGAGAHYVVVANQLRDAGIELTLREFYSVRQKLWGLKFGPGLPCGDRAGKVVEAARRCFGTRTFTLADLAVAAWRLHPDLFSLEGYSYPDNKKIASYLCGPRGLVGRVFVKVAPNTYRLMDGDP